MDRKNWRFVGLILAIGGMLACQVSNNLSATSMPTVTPVATTTVLPVTPPSFPTIEPTGNVTQPEMTPGNSKPGLLISGRVVLEENIPVEGVKIYCAFASYSGVVVAVTDSGGNYTADFLFIPGDEMVRVWAVKDEYFFKPSGTDPGWESGVYYWRHYYGFESRELDFIAVPEWKIIPK